MSNSKKKSKSDIVNTKTREKAFRKLMKELAKGKRNTRKICKKLAHPEEGPYMRTRDASEFLDAVVKADSIPVRRSETTLERTDLKHQGQVVLE